MVLDKTALPLSRLWCLYEVAETEAAHRQRRQTDRGGTPTEAAVTLMTPGSELKDLADIWEKVDVAKAGCFDKTSEAMIRTNIKEKFGTEEAMNKELKLLLASILTDMIRKVAHN